jgi:hypothetical protein
MLLNFFSVRLFFDGKAAFASVASEHTHDQSALSPFDGGNAQSSASF